MKHLSKIDPVGEWSKCYTCVWCGEIWQVYASDIQFRVNKTTLYSSLGDYDIIKSDVYFVACPCGKEIQLPDTDLIFSMREAIKTRGMFPKEPIQERALKTSDSPKTVDWQQCVEDVYSLLTYRGDPKEVRATKALDHLNTVLGRESLKLTKTLKVGPLPSSAVPCYAQDPFNNRGWFSRGLDYLRGLC